MSAREYTSPPTITINGVRIAVSHIGAKRAPVDPLVAVEQRFGVQRRAAARVEFTIADSGDAFAAITRMIDEANREVSRAILPAPSESGRWYSWGSRGCFHEGCDGTGGVEDGGSHWCRWAT